MAFVTEAALIALREGLEALLITGMLLSLVTRMGRPDARRHVWLGFWAAVASSVVAGVLIQRYLFAFFEQQGGGAWFELIAALLAVVTLTYMVFWMWNHTAHVIREAKQRARIALTAGSLVTIAFITYISVIREGLETVLFYSALAGQSAIVDIAWSGLVGFAFSAVLVYAIFRGARHIGLKRFFTATGAFLIIVAAMLLTHVVGAVTELGWIDPQPAIWDTSAAIPDDSALGRLLHATMGYTATPSLLQAGLYFGYLFIAGGLFAWQAGAFHRSTTEGRRLIGRRLAAAGAVVLLIVAGVGAAGANPTDQIAGHSHGPGEDHADSEPLTLPEDLQVGVMLRNHGEPIHYNETTYQSFADFTRELLVMMGFEALLEIDQGTVLVDKAHPFQEGPRLDASYMDAWTQDHPGPAIWVSSPAPSVAQVPVMDGYYVAPGGPGLGEPDVLEAAGLSAYKSWVQMAGTSPMHGAKMGVLDRTQRMLEERYGEQIQVERGFSIRPHAGGNLSLAAAAEHLAEGQPDLLVDAYTSHLHSDIMDTCMMQPAFAQALDQAGYQGEIVRSAPSGLTEVFAEGIAEPLARQLEALPADQPVAVFLTNHGMAPGTESMCQDGQDPYNEQAQRMFEATAQALQERLPDRQLLVLQVYGQGASAEEDGVLSPEEALEEAQAWGAERVLDLPYELPGNGYDNLVNHRLHYDLDPAEAPHYGPGYETRLTRYGMAVTILSSEIAQQARAEAQVVVIEEALHAWLDEHGAVQEGHEH